MVTCQACGLNFSKKDQKPNKVENYEVYICPHCGHREKVRV